jgi:predicted anti-sigma-YlaC factor YlaD
MKHYSEADLLETYYTQPGAAMPVMMHLADCAECQARYERLERKLRSLSSCESEKPETFWSRQRHGVMRRVARQRSEHTPRTMRVAAAAVLAFVLGGLAMWQTLDRRNVAQPVTATVTTTAPATEVTVPADPWQSDELKDYQSMVAWESWGEPVPTRGES